MKDKKYFVDLENKIKLEKERKKQKTEDSTYEE
jgi:hypothetical protein